MTTDQYATLRAALAVADRDNRPTVTVDRAELGRLVMAYDRMVGAIRAGGYRDLVQVRRGEAGNRSGTVAESTADEKRDRVREIAAEVADKDGELLRRLAQGDA